MTKAEEKRIRDNERYILSGLNRTLRKFKNRVLSATASWAVGELELRLEQVISGERKTAGWTQQQHIEHLKKTLECRALISFEAMKEAEINFDGKVAKMASKMAGFGMSHLRFSVEIVRNSGRELEFLVSDRDMEVHARAIWVEGTIKAPHYRFITTKRTLK